MELLLLAVLVTLRCMVRHCNCISTVLCSSLTYDFSPRIKDGALHFPVFHRKHPCINEQSVHAASISDAGSVIGNDEILNGKYFMAISLGTPAVFNLVTIDTGSTLSWVQCRKCQIKCHKQAEEAGNIFDPEDSARYHDIGCSNDDCIDLHEVYNIPFGCIEETDTCLYSLRYGSSQYTVGKLGKDRLALGNSNNIIADEFIFGCSEDDMFKGSEAGIIGFGNKSYSFFNQVVRQTSYRAFAYCFPSDHKSEGFLTVGPYPPKLEVSTPLILGYGKSWYPHAYSLLPVDMTVDGKRLDVHPSVYRRKLMIVDSGTADTFLSSSIYYAFDEAMAVAMRDKGYVRVYDTNKNKVCFYRSAGGGSVDWSGLPNVEMKFLRAHLTLPPQNVFYELPGGWLCLAFQPDMAGVEGVQILGNKATRSFRVVYDLQMMYFRFQARAC